MTQAEYDSLQLVKQVGGLVVKDYVELTYKELEAFAKLVDAKATAREREKILRLSTKAKNIDGNCDIVLAADIRGNKA